MSLSDGLSAPFVCLYSIACGFSFRWSAFSFEGYFLFFFFPLSCLHYNPSPRMSSATGWTSGKTSTAVKSVYTQPEKSKNNTKQEITEANS